MEICIPPALHLAPCLPQPHSPSHPIPFHAALPSSPPSIPLSPFLSREQGDGFSTDVTPRGGQKLLPTGMSWVGLVGISV